MLDHRHPVAGVSFQNSTGTSLEHAEDGELENKTTNWTGYKKQVLVISCRNSIFQFPNKLHSDFCGIVPLQLVLNKPHAHFQLNLKVEGWVNYFHNHCYYLWMLQWRLSSLWRWPPWNIGLHTSMNCPCNFVSPVSSVGSLDSVHSKNIKCGRGYLNHLEPS